MTYHVEFEEVMARQPRYVDVRCDECSAPFTEHAFGTACLDEHGRWKSVAPRDALRVEMHGGFGWYIDIPSLPPTVLLCTACIERLLSSFPSLRRAIDVALAQR